jgi:hypothetical protein
MLQPLVALLSACLVLVGVITTLPACSCDDKAEWAAPQDAVWHAGRTGVSYQHYAGSLQGKPFQARLWLKCTCTSETRVVLAGYLQVLDSPTIRFDIFEGHRWQHPLSPDGLEPP